METPVVRVLVVGDSGVGKTTLLRGLCRDVASDPRGNAAQSHRWTIGCDVHVLLYQHREQYGAMKDMYIEFVDVGGHAKYEISRAMFYNDVQGIILVHDLSNAKSYDHLRRWMSEINDTQRSKGCVLPPSYNHRGNDFPSLSAMPKLVVGNKRDLISLHTKRSNGASELRGIDTMEASAEPFSLDANVFYGFLDRVVSFANASNGVTHDASTNDFSNGGSAFASGLRQTNTRPQSPASAAGSGISGGSWWR